MFLVIEAYLDPNHIPDLLPHREGEINAVFEMIRPLIENRRPSNIFIHGGAGIGKTAVAKLVLRELKPEGVYQIYINCWYHRTEAAVLAEILRQMSVPFPRKGRGIDELITEFLERVKNERLLVVLDEIDLLESPDVLYELSRASPTIGIMLISNDQYATKNFDSRVLSSLALSTIEFKKYTVEELIDILQERAKLARLNVNELALRVAARLAFKNNSDVRFGLSLLLKAGRVVKISGDILTVDLIKQFDVVQSPKQEHRKTEIQPDHKKILDALKTMGGEGFSKEVFETYLKNDGKIAERTFRKYVRQLINWKFVGEEEVPGRGRRRKLRILP